MYNSTAAIVIKENSSPWVCDSGVSADAHPKTNSIFPGPQANHTRATTAPNIIRRCITKLKKSFVNNDRIPPSPFLFINFLVKIV